jgi:hypothetical protein
MYGRKTKGRSSRVRPRYGLQLKETSLRPRIFARTYDLGHEVAVRSLSTATAVYGNGAAAEYEVPASGWPLAETGAALAASVEYQVRPAGWGLAGATPSPVAPCGAPAAVDSPQLRPQPRTAAPSAGAPVPAASAPAPAAQPTTPYVKPAAPQPSPAPDPDPTPGISDDVLMSDIQSILNAGKQPASSPTASSPQVSPETEHPSTPAAPAAQDPLPNNRQEIFDRIAESMARANAYDLGSIALQQRFDTFDRQMDALEAPAKTGAAPDLANPGPASTAEFVQDLDRMKQEALVDRAASEIPLDPGVGGRSIGTDALDPGDIILSTTAAGISEAIRAVTDSPVSHSAIYIGDNQVVEAIGDGVILRSLDTALEDDSLAVAYRHRDMTPEKAAKVVEFLKDQARQKRSYDRWGLVRAAPGQLARAICNHLPADARRRCLEGASRLRVGTDDKDAFYCSELVLEALSRAGLSLSNVEQSWSSPGQILDLHYNGLLDYVGHLKA